MTVSEALDRSTVETLEGEWAVFGEGAERHTYLRPFQKMSWEDAEAYANAVDGYLVAINSEDEQEWLHKRFSEIVGSVNDRDFWIGLNDRDVEGEWVWPTGPLQEGDYQNWVTGQPRIVNSYDGVTLPGDRPVVTHDHINPLRHFVVERDTALDADGNGIPDVVDLDPNDARNNWRLEAAGEVWNVWHRGFGGDRLPAAGAVRGHGQDAGQLRDPRRPARGRDLSVHGQQRSAR